MSRDRFDIAVGDDASKGIIDVDIFSYGPQTSYRAMVPRGNMYCFPMVLSEAKTLRDMLNEAIEHVEAGGHG